MANAILDPAAANLETCYANAGGPNVGTIPWATILTDLLGLPGNCTPAAVKRIASRHPAAFTAIVELNAARLPAVAAGTCDVSYLADATLNAVNAYTPSQLGDIMKAKP
jgi:hypothetical protein